MNREVTFMQPVLGYELFVRIIEGDGKGTVLCLHGGPGGSHDVLLPLADLAEWGYTVIFYDQLGCGRSTRAADTGSFTVAHYIAEVEAVVSALAVEEFHLFGWSWGGMLSFAYAIDHPSAMQSIVNCGGPASIPLYREKIQELLTNLPAHEQDVVRDCEARRDYDRPEYQRIIERVRRRHDCRIAPMPREVQVSLPELGPPATTMWGRSYFDVTGTLRAFDVRDDLARVEVPCLLTVGAHDNVRPAVMADAADRLRDARLMVFDASSHLPMWEERDGFIRTIGDFFAEDREAHALRH